MLAKNSVHFIIPSYKGHETIKACLDSIADQDYPKELIQISVIENGPKTNINSLIQHYDNCTYHFNPVEGRSQARSFILDKVKSEFIAFIDVDVILSKTWLREILKSAKSPYCAAATGPVFRKGNRWIDEYRRKMSENPNTMELPGALGCMNTAAVLMRTSALKQVGGFDCSFKRSEDLELTHRLLRSGFIISTSKTASADVYWNRSHFEYFFTRFFQMGMYTAKAMIRHNIKNKKVNSTFLFKLGYLIGRIKFSRTLPYCPKIITKRLFVSNRNLQMTAYEWNPKWEIILIQNIVRLYHRERENFLLPFDDVEKIILDLLETSFSHVEGAQDEKPLNKMIKDQILIILNMPKVKISQVFDENI